MDGRADVYVTYGIPLAVGPRNEPLKLGLDAGAFLDDGLGADVAVLITAVVDEGFGLFVPTPGTIGVAHNGERTGGLHREVIPAATAAREDQDPVVLVDDAGQVGDGITRAQILHDAVHAGMGLWFGHVVLH